MPNKNTTLEQRKAVVKRLNPNNTPYLHTFEAQSGECTDCHRKLIDEVFIDEKGQRRINMFCPVIGRDELRFDTEDF